MTALLIIEGLAIILLAVLVVGLLRSHAEILRALHQLGAGVGDHQENAADRFARPRPRLVANGAQDFVGTTLGGSTVHIGVSGTEHRTLLAFLSTGCASCLTLWEGMRSEDPLEGLENTRLVLVAKDRESESQSRLEQLAPAGHTLVQTTEAWEEYGVPVTPYFVLVDGVTGAVIGEGSASSWGQVRSLIGQAVADAGARSSGDGDEMAADRELRKAGIGPGHESLYPPEAPEEER
jgi:hypothetical protein